MVHCDMCMHTGWAMSMGQGSFISMAKKQNFNMNISTKSELASALMCCQNVVEKTIPWVSTIMSCTRITLVQCFWRKMGSSWVWIRPIISTCDNSSSRTLLHVATYQWITVWQSRCWWITLQKRYKSTAKKVAAIRLY